LSTNSTCSDREMRRNRQCKSSQRPAKWRMFFQDSFNNGVHPTNSAEYICMSKGFLREARLEFKHIRCSKTATKGSMSMDLKEMQTVDEFIDRFFKNISSGLRKSKVPLCLKLGVDFEAEMFNCILCCKNICICRHLCHDLLS
jgi:hypothetical protein